MKPRLLLAMAMFLAPAGAVLLDRIAVTVGNFVITESEIAQEIRVTAFLNGEPVDLSAEARRAAAERLIDQNLIRRDMHITNFTEPESSEADKLLANLKRRQFGSDAKYRQALERYGITEKELKAHLLWQLAALRYTDFRFQPNAPGATEAVRQHLEEHTNLRAEARTGNRRAARELASEENAAAAGNASATELASGNAAQSGNPAKAVPPAVDQQMDAWLKQARSSTRIVYHKEAFQ